MAKELVCKVNSIIGLCLNYIELKHGFVVQMSTLSRGGAKLPQV